MTDRQEPTTLDDYKHQRLWEGEPNTGEGITHVKSSFSDSMYWLFTDCGKSSYAVEFFPVARTQLVTCLRCLATMLT